jgi:hypothetical protein
MEEILGYESRSLLRKNFTTEEFLDYGKSSWLWKKFLTLEEVLTTEEVLDQDESS